MSIDIEKTEKVFKQLTISKSSLFEYMLCPWSWHKRRILKDEPSNQVNISALIRGSVVHKMDEFLSADNYKSTNDLDIVIIDVFMEKINEELSKKTIKAHNLYDLCKEFGKDNVIFEKNGERKFRMTYGIYEKADITFKDKIDEMFPTISQHIENIKIGMRNIISENVRVEIKEENYIDVDDMTIKTISIFDKVFEMNFDDLTTFKPEQVTLSDSLDYYENFTKSHLLQVAELQGIAIDKKMLKAEMIEVLAEETLNALQEVIADDKQRERTRLRKILEGNGYKAGDTVPVIMDVKTSNKKSNPGNIRNMIDPYIYSAIYFMIYGKIPVFMIMKSVVTKTLSYNQTFHIGITHEMLQDWYYFFIEKIKCMYSHEYYNKNLINNWKCSSDYCQYFEECQKNKITVFER